MAFLMETLRRLVQQLLGGSKRLVLCNTDAGYPDRAHSSTHGRGRWLDNIEGTDAKTFLRAGSSSFVDGLVGKYQQWHWPAAVLMPEEYSLRVGEMSVTELRSQLEKYWGRGGIPGTAVEEDYQDRWIPAWAPLDDDDPYNLSWHVRSVELQVIPRLDPAAFSRWVNRECAKWFGYFIAKDHTLGVVHAWFAAFLGVTRQSLWDIARSLRGTSEAQDPNSVEAAISCLRFRMSFDLCMENYEEAIDGIPSLPLGTKTTIIKGVRAISNRIQDIYPRRLWDICANTVIPATWFCGPACPLTGYEMIKIAGVRPVSHAWVAGGDLAFIMTEVNQQLWPIPLPRGTQLEDVRKEMIRLGVRYAWLDVLCLRQQALPPLANHFANPVSQKDMETLERREQCRLEEWKVDVPTIGAIYTNPDPDGIYGAGPIVIFMNGLGRPFQDGGWASERHWLRRAWTLQETPPLNRCLIAGLPEGANYQWNGLLHSRLLWPWNCKVCNGFSQTYTTELRPAVHNRLMMIAASAFTPLSKMPDPACL